MSRSPELSKVTPLKVVLVAALALSAAGCEAPSHGTTKAYDQANAKFEPRCLGTSVLKVDTYDFKLTPTLNQPDFKNNNNVVSYLVTPPTSSSPTPEASPNGLVNTSGGSVAAQRGSGFELGIDSASRIPTQLVIDDYNYSSAKVPKDLDRYYSPSSTYTITCPTIVLAELAGPLLDPSVPAGSTRFVIPNLGFLSQ